MFHAAMMAAALLACSPADDPETIVVRADNTPIDRSCRVEFAPDAALTDPDGNGILHIVADGVTVEFAPMATLRGAPESAPGDELAGVGIRIDGRKGVTLKGPHIRGCKVGIHATRADGLTIEGGDFADMYRMRLLSTPAAEDAADWLWPHKNDSGEWRSNSGGAIVVEDSRGVTLRDNRVRRAQNGIILDRVSDSRVYDNDCSFLSGWGVAMWRSSGNTITRNALDFCIRGYSHGVYNRGQDSAGLLMFEQCSRNIVAENSMTHSGDGVFGFAGHDALGETYLQAERERLRAETGKKQVDDLVVVPSDMVKDRVRAGCNDNVFLDNDLSYAAAHGLEMTFSFGNRIIGNRFSANAICGVWGGYSADTLIAGNYFENNGGAGYGEERGGVNIEHGRDNRIVANTFSKNAAGVHLWSRSSAAFAKMPWALANAEDDGHGNVAVPSARNIIAGNTFDGDRTAVRLRACRSIIFVKNTVREVRTELDLGEGDPDASPSPDTASEIGAAFDTPKVEVFGKRRPVSARDDLAGRNNIVMTEWGPWEHDGVLFRERQRGPAADVYEIFGVRGEIKAESLEPDSPKIAIVPREPGAPSGVPAQVILAGPRFEPGVWPYAVRITGEGLDRTVRGVLVVAEWNVRLWPWKADPMKDVEAWRAEATGPTAVAAVFDRLNLPFGYRSPSAMNLAPVVNEANLPREKFGVIARTVLPLRAGQWLLRVKSDDGVRVFVRGEQVIERWNIHGPADDQHTISVERDEEVPISVEYFQNDGYAALSVTIEPAGSK